MCCTATWLGAFSNMHFSSDGVFRLVLSMQNFTFYSFENFPKNFSHILFYLAYNSIICSFSFCLIFILLELCKNETFHLNKHFVVLAFCSNNSTVFNYLVY